MRRFKAITALILVVMMVLPSVTPLYAQLPARLSDRTNHISQMGFFGGISEGVRLPGTTEIILQQNDTSNRQNGNLQIENLMYTEMIWLAGQPVEWEGLMSVNIRNTTSGGRNASPNEGTREVRYRVRNSDSSPEDLLIDRDIRFTVRWRRQGNQITETYTVAQNNHWSETILVGDEAFLLDARQSHFEVSILRDITPGVTYFTGDISMRAVYINDEGDTVVHTVIGEIFGYESAWSVTETQHLRGIVDFGFDQLQYEVVPSVSMNKDLQYAPTQPNLISFDGNYREVMSNQSALMYVIRSKPDFLYGIPTTGRASISTFNSFEQLFAPDVSFLRGHWAYGDIRRLFAMEVLRGNPAHFQPNQGVSRGEFITMLARAVKLPLDDTHLQEPRADRRGVNPIAVIFPDVWHGRPDFPYIMAANSSGIVVGRGAGHFQPDQIIHREEAYVIALRALGLSNLGLSPTPITPFTDDHMVGDWARRDIYAAARIGLIAPDENGMMHPRRDMHKAEAAALINRLIEYMRHELQRDYTENIVNFLN